MKDQRLVIVEGVRTPFCRAGTVLTALPADELGRIAVSALLTRTGLDPGRIDEVIFGCVAQPAEAANVARVIALRAGIPDRVPAMTVQRNCASGMEALAHAGEKMAAGRGSVFVVGGAESMSRIPLLYPFHTAEKFQRLRRARSPAQRLKALGAFRWRDFRPRIGLQLGFTDPVCGLNMGETAELLARESGISREEQDAFALESHRRAVAARERLAEEICPIYPGHGVRGRVVSDNGPRKDPTMEALHELRPVFDRRTGTVTAGNASQITDGAVALLVMSEARAGELGYAPLAVLTGYASAGCDPARMGLGPLFAFQRLEEQTGFSISKADLIEINEAFAAQVLAVMNGSVSTKFARKYLGRSRSLGEIPRDRLNVNGGAIALGHPVGATGARLILTAAKELKRRKTRTALISACVGGGQGVALSLETL